MPPKKVIGIGIYAFSRPIDQPVTVNSRRETGLTSLCLRERLHLSTPTIAASIWLAAAPHALRPGRDPDGVVGTWNNRASTESLMAAMTLSSTGGVS